MHKVRRFLSELIFSAENPIRLHTFQRAYTLAFLIYGGSLLLHPFEWLTAEGYHYTVESMNPALPKPFPTLPPLLVPVFALAFVGASLSVIAGTRSKIPLFVLLGAAIYMQGVDIVSACSMSAVSIVVFAVLVAAPPLVVMAPGDPPQQSGWPLRILQATIIIFYFTAGYTKAFHGHWLSDPEVLWTQLQGIYRTELAAWALNSLPKGTWTAMMYGTLAFELLAPLLFLIPRLRLIGVFLGIAFHLGIAMMMNGLIHFSLQMMAFYTLFLTVDQIRFLLSWFQREIPNGTDQPVMLGGSPV